MNRALGSLLIAAASLAVGWLGERTLAPIDRAVFDALLDSYRPAASPDPVVFVLARRWPAPRSRLAEAVRRAAAAGSGAIALDVALSEIVPGDPYRNEKESAELAAALGAVPRAVVAVERDGSGKLVPPHPSFASASIGLAHFKLDPDGVIRRVALRATDGDRRVWAFGFKAAQLMLGVEDSALPPEPLPGRFQLGRATLEAPGGMMLVRYGQGPRLRSTEPVPGLLMLEEWLASAPAGDRAWLEGKLVFIGADTGAGGDSFRTPVSGPGGDEPGIGVHAEVARTVLRGDAPASVSRLLFEPALLVACAAIAAAAVSGPGWLWPLLLVGIGAGFGGWCVPAAFASRGTVMPVAGAFSALAAAALLGWLQRRRIRSDVDAAREFLERHLRFGGSIGDLLSVQRDIEQHLKRFEVERAVMFTDIKGSTTYFSTRGDQAGRAMVERHNRLLFPHVEKSGGEIIKTIGDAIMAVFAKPGQAVKAAIAMQRALAEANSARGEPAEEIHVRIGVNFGRGIADPKDLFGNLVNVAARVEALADGDQILVTASVYEALPEDLARLCRPAGRKAIRGTGGELELYEVDWKGKE